MTDLTQATKAKRSHRLHSLARMLWLMTCVASGGLAQAQIRTDGSVGPAAQSLAGPLYQIPQTLGKLAGGNLFHSFQTFNLGSGQSANFSTSTPGINNVISRVTGGQVSQINGALSLTAASGSPAFYFINPAGVTFGAGASVDVPGAFHVSSANSVRFADGRFNADLNQASTFSTAAPEAFGFLGNSRASIEARDGAVLSPRGTFPISVVAGDIALADGALIGARNGEIRVVAVGGIAADIPFTGQIPRVEGNLAVSNEAGILALNRVDLPPGSVNVHAGHIALSDVGNITSRNAGSGNAAAIQIQSNTASFESGGYVYSRVFKGGLGEAGSGKGADIDLKIAQGLTLGQDASISTETYASGQAGHIRVQAGKLDASSRAYFGSQSHPDSAGATGNVDIVAAESIKLSDANAWIRADGSGAAGTLRLAATDITLSNSANVFILSASQVPFAGDIVLNAQGSLALSGGSAIAVNFQSIGTPGNVQITGGAIVLDTGSLIFSGPVAVGDVGRAGSIFIKAADNLDIRNESKISSSTFSVGDAGSTSIQARHVNLDKGQISAITGGAGGNGGKVQIAATGSVTLGNDSTIFANSFSRGNAGAVSISSAELSLSGGSSVGSKSLGNAASTGEVVAGGDAGDIRINTLGTLSIKGGNVSSSTATTGRGGSVDVNARVISLDGSTSNINAAATFGSTGNAGSLNLTASDTILLANGAFITNANFATVAPVAGRAAPTLLLAAPQISVFSGAIVSTEATGLMSAGNIDVSAGQLSMTDGLLSTRAEQGDGGSIAVRSSRVVLTQSQITTSVLGQPTATGGITGFGNGGDIRIDADAVVLKTGFIQANTAAQAASGGRVLLNVNTLAASGNTLFLGGQTPFQIDRGLFAFNVIQAAAPTGISGAIEVTSPVLDLTGSLGRLSAQVLDGAALGRDPCRSTASSSLALVGRGGLPISSRGLLGAPATLSAVAPSTASLSLPWLSSPHLGALPQALPLNQFALRHVGAGSARCIP